MTPVLDSSPMSKSFKPTPFGRNSFVIDELSVNVQVNKQMFDRALGNAVDSSPFFVAKMEDERKSDQPNNDKHNPIHFDIGIDEVGRGPLYGNVVIGAVILPNEWSYAVDENNVNKLCNTPLANLTDSKKISEKKRNLLQPNIEANAIAYATVDVPAHVIDKLNIYQATLLGMKIASEVVVMAVFTSLAHSTCLTGKVICPTMTLLVDGNALPKFAWQSLSSRYSSMYNPSIFDNLIMASPDCHNLHCGNFYSNSFDFISAETWIKGDARHTAIAAASVIAKVRRDKQLIQAGERYPEYGLQKHKGYPTKAHIQALRQYGVLPEHRRSFKPVQQVI